MNLNSPLPFVQGFRALHLRRAPRVCAAALSCALRLGLAAAADRRPRLSPVSAAICWCTKSPALAAASRWS
jgi:hypothetical protein